MTNPLPKSPEEPSSTNVLKNLDANARRSETTLLAEIIDTADGEPFGSALFPDLYSLAAEVDNVGGYPFGHLGGAPLNMVTKKDLVEGYNLSYEAYATYKASFDEKLAKIGKSNHPTISGFSTIEPSIDQTSQAIAEASDPNMSEAEQLAQSGKEIPGESENKPDAQDEELGWERRLRSVLLKQMRGAVEINLPNVYHPQFKRPIADFNTYIHTPLYALSRALILLKIEESEVGLNSKEAEEGKVEKLDESVVGSGEVKAEMRFKLPVKIQDQTDVQEGNSTSYLDSIRNDERREVVKERIEYVLRSYGTLLNSQLDVWLNSESAGLTQVEKSESVKYIEGLLAEAEMFLERNVVLNMNNSEESNGSDSSEKDNSFNDKMASDGIVLPDKNSYLYTTCKVWRDLELGKDGLVAAVKSLQTSLNSEVNDREGNKYKSLRIRIESAKTFEKRFGSEAYTQHLVDSGILPLLGLNTPNKNTLSEQGDLSEDNQQVGQISSEENSTKTLLSHEYLDAYKNFLTEQKKLVLDQIAILGIDPKFEENLLKLAENKGLGSLSSPDFLEKAQNFFQKILNIVAAETSNSLTLGETGDQSLSPHLSSLRIEDIVALDWQSAQQVKNFPLGMIGDKEYETPHKPSVIRVPDPEAIKLESKYQQQAKRLLLLNLPLVGIYQVGGFAITDRNIQNLPLLLARQSAQTLDARSGYAMYTEGKFAEQIWGVESDLSVDSAESNVNIEDLPAQKVDYFELVREFVGEEDFGSLDQNSVTNYPEYQKLKSILLKILRAEAELIYHTTPNSIVEVITDALSHSVNNVWSADELFVDCEMRITTPGELSSYFIGLYKFQRALEYVKSLGIPKEQFIKIYTAFACRIDPINLAEALTGGKVSAQTV